MDALKLGERAVDQLHPYLSNLMNNMNKINSLPSDFDGKVKVKEWYVGRSGPVLAYFCRARSG